MNRTQIYTVCALFLLLSNNCCFCFIFSSTAVMMVVRKNLGTTWGLRKQMICSQRMMHTTSNLNNTLHDRTQT
uniref:Uncharacterized protein n=1 Tax=Anopheles braziliensis TaxID=58242 RepID=A0A2M3ZLY5_9DIPT